MNTKTIRNLQEAYSDVYAPQELTQDQIWEEVENWVNALLEEGYDLSDYTWEEMYEEWGRIIVENREMAYGGGKSGSGSGDGGKPTPRVTGGTTYKMKGFDDDKDAKKEKLKGV